MLGNFLSCFEVAGVTISCILDHQVYHFAQWATCWGKIVALGQCRHILPERYDALWLQAPQGSSIAPSGTQPLNVHGLSDEQVLQHFVRRVACDGAVLTYNDRYDDGASFRRWRNTQGRQWTRAVSQGMRRQGQPLWTEAEFENQEICPATFEEVIRVTGANARHIADERARQYGWDKETVDLLKHNPRRFYFT